jgi:hypothetical protein
VGILTGVFQFFKWRFKISHCDICAAVQKYYLAFSPDSQRIWQLADIKQKHEINNIYTPIFESLHLNALFFWAMRNIHAPYKPFMLCKAHGYCATHFEFLKKPHHRAQHSLRKNRHKAHSNKTFQHH